MGLLTPTANKSVTKVHSSKLLTTRSNISFNFNYLTLLFQPVSVYLLSTSNYWNIITCTHIFAHKKKRKSTFFFSECPPPWLTSAGTDVEEHHLSGPAVSQPRLFKQQLLLLHLLFLAQKQTHNHYTAAFNVRDCSYQKYICELGCSLG